MLAEKCNTNYDEYVGTMLTSRLYDSAVALFKTIFKRIVYFHVGGSTTYNFIHFRKILQPLFIVVFIDRRQSFVNATRTRVRSRETSCPRL